MMKEFGGTDEMYQIKINSRKLINLIMSQYLELDAAQSKQMISLFDKKNKMDNEMFIKQALEVFTSSQKLSSEAKIKALLETRSLADLPDELKSSQAVKEVQILFTLLGEHGITTATFDISLMRGFDYYTDIVFEVFDTAPDNNRSLFGGGRYDGLVASFGVEPIGTVGFGMGDATIENFLEVHKLLPILAPATQVYVVTIGQVLKDAQTVVAELRAGGLNVAVDITPRKPEKQVKAALKLGVPYLLFIGEEEIKNKTFILRKVENQEEETLTAAAIIEKLSS